MVCLSDLLAFHMQRGMVASGSEILNKNFTLFTKVSFVAAYSDA